MLIYIWQKRIYPPPSPQATGKKTSIAVVLQGWLRHRKITNIDMPLKQRNQTMPNSAPLAGAVEYADYISAEGWDPTHATSVLLWQNHLMVRLKSWRFGEYRISLLPGSLWLGVVVFDKVPSVGQIKLFNLLIVCKQMSIIWIVSVTLLLLRPFNCVQTNDDKWNNSCQIRMLKTVCGQRLNNCYCIAILGNICLCKWLNKVE